MNHRLDVCSPHPLPNLDAAGHVRHGECASRAVDKTLASVSSYGLCSNVVGARIREPHLHPLHLGLGRHILNLVVLQHVGHQELDLLNGEEATWTREFSMP